MEWVRSINHGHAEWKMIYRSSELCSAFWSVQKPVFHQYLAIRCAYSNHRCLKVEIWRFLCPQQQRTDKPIILPLAHAHGVKRTKYNILYRNIIQLPIFWTPLMSVNCVRTLRVTKDLQNNITMIPWYHELKISGISCIFDLICNRWQNTTYLLPRRL